MSLQGSMLSLSQSKRINKRKSRGWLNDGLDTECTPTEPIMQLTSPRKFQRLFSKGKENEGGQFVLGKRSRAKKEHVSGR